MKINKSRLPIESTSSNGVICIIGMHRSGTSMVTQLLNFCGLYLGENESMLPAKKENAFGFFENVDFVYKVNDPLLHHFNGAWDNPPLFDTQWENEDALSTFSDIARSIVDGFPKNTTWGWKDPRTTILLPFWKKIIPDLKFVICVRSPLEVAKSLLDRNGKTTKESFNLWNRYMRDAIRYTENHPRAFVFYEDFFENKSKIIPSLIKFCGLTKPDDPLFPGNIIKNELKHKSAETLDLLIDDRCITEYKLLYLGIRSLNYEGFLNTPKSFANEDTISNNITKFVHALDLLTQGHESAQLQSNIAILERKQSESSNLLSQKGAEIVQLKNSTMDQIKIVEAKEEEINFMKGSILELKQTNNDLQGCLQEKSLRSEGLRNINSKLTQKLDATIQFEEMIIHSRSWQMGMRLLKSIKNFRRSFIGKTLLFIFWTLNFTLLSKLRQNKEIKILESTKVFDKEFYLERYPAIKYNLLNPLEHYIMFGYKEGRSPNSWFETTSYIRRFPEIRKSGDNPLVHFLENGGNKEVQQIENKTKAESKTIIYSANNKISNTNEKIPSALYISGCGGDSERYRCSNAVEEHELYGGRARAMMISDTALFQSLGNFDIIVLHRVHFNNRTKLIVETANALGKILIYDIDDLLFDENEIGYLKHNRGIPIKLEKINAYGRMMKECNLIICPTQTLADAASRYAAQALVIPNAVSCQIQTASEIARSSETSKSGENLVLGYASGSATHDNDFKIAAAGIVKAMKQNSRLCLRIIGPLRLPSIMKGIMSRIELTDHVPWQQLPRKLAEFDINLAPMEAGIPFCEAKSELKYFESAFVGVPTIASPTKTYRSTITHGENGFIARNTEDWKTLILKLAESENYRNKIGQKALSQSNYTFSTKIVGKNRIEVFKNILTNANLHQVE